ncbi:MAG: riboflavin synthase [Fusobacteriaceae bacterium]|nr:riboflavin synthase [Fusobacteriaceae bacterium]MBP9509932.1 riboflavin synthase [Fusobacteriaceae bacterium]
MFTGLIEEMGTVSYIKHSSKGVKLKVNCKKVILDAKIGDSIATSGVCLTVVELGKDFYVADVMNESLDRSGLKSLKMGNKVNLEKSLTLNTPLGGHLVTGDVECQGKIIKIKNDGFSKIYAIEIPSRYSKYIIEKGRVTIDGASLTISAVEKNNFSVSIIPHTQKMITLGINKIGDLVNIETDIIGKFIEKSSLYSTEDCYSKDNIKESSKINKKFLLENGFL